MCALDMEKCYVLCIIIHLTENWSNFEWLKICLSMALEIITIIDNYWQLLTWISTVAVFSAHLMRAHDRGASMPVSIVIFLFLWFADIVTILMSAPWNKSLSIKKKNYVIWSSKWSMIFRSQYIYIKRHILGLWST